MREMSKFLRGGKREDSRAASNATTSNRQGTNNNAASSTSPSTDQPCLLPIPSATVPRFPDGVKVWINPPDAAIDVCFVHGLTGDRDTTWTAPGQSEPWPPMLLPGRLPKARLLTYGYDAYVVGKSVASINTLSDHATNLVRDLTDDRQSCDATSRRIIFVAHSLGGLVCKEAILQSRHNPDTHFRDIFRSVVGIIFMGTPHAGSWIADWANIPARALGVIKSTNKTLLEILKTDSPLLQSIHGRFLSMVRELRESKRPFEVTCFFEELPLGVLDRVVVTKASATFEGYSVSSIHANHSDMVKFRSAEDNGFKRLSGDLIRWAKLPSSGHQVTLVTAHVETDRNRAAPPGCLRSLSFPEMDDRFNDIDHATEGTCEWLLRHEKYNEWAACDRGLLWIKGKPGSGKSTLLQYALGNASTNIGDRPLILSFFFHGRGVELQKKPLGFFRSVLHQILRHAPDTLSGLVTTFEHRCNNRGEPNKDWQWHSRELLNFLKSSLLTLSGNRPIWLFVDALDESGKKNAIDLVRDFKALLQEYSSTNSQFHICFTCRHYPILDLNYGFEICLEHENMEDISSYVQTHLSAYTVSTIPDTILKTVTTRASGIFLWARLVTERIIDLERDGIGWKEIEAKINDIPGDLDDLYRGLVKSMDNRSASLKLIQWICFATRPLSLVELQWAMVTDAKCTYQSMQECQSDIVDDDTMKRRIQTLSCGLAEIALSSNEDPLSSDEDSLLSYGSWTSSEGRNGAVQFIHQSVKDFFVEKGLAILDSVSKSTESAIGNAHYQLSRACIRYLAMKEVGLIPRPVSILTSKFPLLQYATKSWVWHERESNERNVSQNDLLDYFAWPSDKLVELWVQLYNEITANYSGPLPEGTRMVHLVSRYRLMGPLQVIMQSWDQIDIGINLQDSDGRTPLSYAAAEGHQAVAQLLLNISNVKADSSDREHRTPLSYAAGSGYLTIVQLLFNTGNINADSKDKWGQTPLSHAAENGHLAVVQLLLNTGNVNVNLRDEWDRTPLSYAAENGHLAVVQLLLNTGNINVNIRDTAGWTPLLYAIRRDRKAIVQLLLNTGNVNVNLRDKAGRTPLLCAAHWGREAIVQLLLNCWKLV